MNEEFKTQRTKADKVVLKCTLCGTKVSLTPEEVKLSKNFGQYILRHEFADSCTAIQAGTLCDACLIIPMEKRMKVKNGKSK